MNNAACDKILASLGKIDLDLADDAERAAHLRACPSCAEALRLATWLQAAARSETPADKLPSASQIWWRARIIRDLIEHESQIQRVTRPTRWMQWTGLGLVGALTSLFLTWQTAPLLLDTILDMASSPAGWRWFAGLLAASAAVPLATFTLLWVTWRDA